jgi:hypothetical protein
MLYCYYCTVPLNSQLKKKSKEKLPGWCKLVKVLVVHLPLLTLYLGIFFGRGVTGGKCDLVVVTYGRGALFDLMFALVPVAALLYRT